MNSAQPQQRSHPPPPGASDHPPQPPPRPTDVAISVETEQIKDKERFSCGTFTAGFFAGLGFGVFGFLFLCCLNLPYKQRRDFGIGCAIGCVIGVIAYIVFYFVNVSAMYPYA